MKLSEDVEELILKGGKTFSTSIIDNIGKKTIIGDRIIESKHLSYNINWLGHRNDVNISTKTINTSKNYIEKFIKYNGKVYCATVPFNKLFVKRNGKAMWCGNSPRVEWLPYFAIQFFNLEFSITFEANVKSQEKYFEMAIWYVFYCDKDIDKARSEWRWLNAVDGKSSWNDNYLINNKLQ